MGSEMCIRDRSPPDGKAVQHLLEATPEDQVAVRKGWMTERRQPVAIAGGKVRVTFPRRSVSIVEIPVILKPEVEATKPL